RIHFRYRHQGCSWADLLRGRERPRPDSPCPDIFGWFSPSQAIPRLQALLTMCPLTEYWIETSTNAVTATSRVRLWLLALGLWLLAFRRDRVLLDATDKTRVPSPKPEDLCGSSR